MLTEHGLPIAASTYSERPHRAPSPREQRDGVLKADVAAVHEANYGVYGARKV